MERTIFDNEKFISFVDPNTCLWNTSDQNYSDRSKKQHCWLQIAKEMNTEFDELTSVKQNEYGKYVYIFIY
jgi:hypothetical protein